jgi:hypothetical protein
VAKSIIKRLEFEPASFTSKRLEEKTLAFFQVFAWYRKPLLREEDHALGPLNGTKIETEFKQLVKVEFAVHLITTTLASFLRRVVDYMLKLASSTATQRISTRVRNRTRDQLADLLPKRVYAMAMSCFGQYNIDHLEFETAF